MNLNSQLSYIQTPQMQGNNGGFQTALNNIGRTWNMISGQNASQSADFNFQEYMRDTQYESLFKQAEKLGISPSLLLGEKGVSSGVSGSTGTAGSGNAVGGVINGILSAVTNIFKEHEKSERAEDKAMNDYLRQEERLNHSTMLAQMKMQNSTTNSQKPADYYDENMSHWEHTNWNDPDIQRHLQQTKSYFEKKYGK